MSGWTPRSASATAAATCSLPTSFEEDERGHCVLVREEIPESLADDARKGVTHCPEDAIEVTG